MMTLAKLTGEVIAEFRDAPDAVSHLIANRMTGQYQLAGLDWEGKFRAQFIAVVDGIGDGYSAGMAIVHMTDRPGHTWHYISTPFPKAVIA